MKKINTPSYVAVDGQIFDSQRKCETYEESIRNWPFTIYNKCGIDVSKSEGVHAFDKEVCFAVLHSAYEAHRFGIDTEEVCNGVGYWTETSPAECAHDEFYDSEPRYAFKVEAENDHWIMMSKDDIERLIHIAKEAGIIK